MRRNLIQLAVIVSAFGLFATACSGDDRLTDPDPGNGDGNSDDDPAIGTTRNDDGEVVIDVDGNEIVLTAGLSGFDSCDNLLAHLRTEAAERVGAYGFEGNGWYGGGRLLDDVVFAEANFDGDDAADSAVTAPRTAVSQATGGEAAIEGVDFSGTNVQEVGVDEADIIKTDGERVFIVANNELVVVDVDRREVVGSIPVAAGWNPELFLSGDDVLLVTTTWFGDERLPQPLPTVDGGISVEEDLAIDEAQAIEPYFYDTSGTVITRISVSDNGPEILETLMVEGDYVSSRGIDGVARVIIRSSPQTNFPFVYPAGSAGEERATESNRQAVMESELSDWIPSYTLLDSDGNQVETGLLPNCGAVHAPTEFSGFGVLSVLSIPVEGAIDPHQATAVLAPGNTVYASTDSIFVATQTWIDWGLFEDDQQWEQAWNARHTSIHRFALSANGAAYTASGSVPGDIRDQFSLSEFDGHLRVITTTGETWDETSETWVRVLRESDGELVEVGSVGDMGNGEAVQSVRFQGDVGYVVTFRQVDPFYTLDLSNPEDPKVVGELKIPGFSSYLHPIGNGMVLGVGSAGDQDGRITGSKVSIFDVSDLANPLEVAVWEAPGGWTDVGWDHRSFLWWGPQQIAVIPVSVYEQGIHWAGAVMLKVDGAKITEVGRIDHQDNDAGIGQTECEQLSSDDLPNSDTDEFRSELEWMVQDQSSLVLRCGPGEDAQAKGFECSAEPWLAEEASNIGIEFDDDEELVVCWSNYQQIPTINRTMVLNTDELWSLSSPWGYYSGDGPVRLQVNDLIDLDRIGVVAVG